MKFTHEQIEELKGIDKVSDLVTIYKRLIWLSDISYSDVMDYLRPEFDEMIQTVCQ